MQKVFLSIIIIFLVSFSAKHAEKFQSVAVLELFTSQGCSSCPPADALLSEVKRTYAKDKVIALSYHVDYWNYIGWKDPFSQKAFSDKQRVYSTKFNSSTIYTPQIVINGKEHFVGSNKGLVKAKLKAYLKTDSKNKVIISKAKREHSMIQFDYDILGAHNEKQARVLLVINSKETFVKRGENRSRTLTNSNIVVAESYLSIANKSGKLSIPELVSEKDKLSLVILIENNELDILGGSQIALD